jgi:NADH:ubiquinone oxidoreductase subunit F (NADH-binding)
VRNQPWRTPPAPPAGVPRIMNGIDPHGRTVDLEAHLSQWGGIPASSLNRGFLAEVEASGLRGHGGAWFPVATKWRSVGDQAAARPVVVANGAEGEPASAKDAFLLGSLPHLVLDGATVAASAIGARRIVLYVPDRFVASLKSAVNHRMRLALDPVPIEVETATDAFISGQESSVVNALNGRAALPSFVGVRSIRTRGVNGRPTLVQNVETLAHVALIARFGSAWFRSVGTPEAPGTMLLTVTGRWPNPRVFEVAIGSPLKDVLGLSGSESVDYQGVLLGGYGGGWLTMQEAVALSLSEPDARQIGSSLGAGIALLVRSDACPLAHVASIVRYLEQEGAGQCGPCVNGLSNLADLCEGLAGRPASLRGSVRPILECCELVEGRGACRHPDGVARMVQTALKVFEDDVRAHLQHGPCRRSESFGAMQQQGLHTPGGRRRSTARAVSLR